MPDHEWKCWDAPEGGCEGYQSGTLLDASGQPLPYGPLCCSQGSPGDGGMHMATYGACKTHPGDIAVDSMNTNHLVIRTGGSYDVCYSTCEYLNW